MAPIPGSRLTPDMSVASEPTRTRVPITARTLRIDRWWLQLVLMQFGLLAFANYSTWVAFQNADHHTAPYISPFYSRCIADNCPVGAQTFHEPFAVSAALSLALIVLIFPLKGRALDPSNGRPGWLGLTICRRHGSVA